MILVQLLVSIIIFIICFQFTILGFWLSAAAGIAAMIVFRLITKLIAKSRQAKAQELAPTDKNAAEVVREGMEKLRQISNSARMVRSNEIAGKIREICGVGVKIFDDVKKNPNHTNKIRQFTNYYLDATKKIIEQYVEFSGKSNQNPEVEKTVQKIEGMLDSIKQTFDKQLANLLENDLLDINTELAVLKNTMKMEG